MTPSECARVLAAPFHIAPADDSFVVARGEQRVRITVDSNSGMIQAIVVTAFGTRLPVVAFTRESTFDRVGKATRIAREAQLGDPTFDPRVYVDSSLDDAAIRALLASPDARAGILALLASCERVEFGEAGIATTTKDEALFVGDHPRLVAHIERLFSVYAALPAAAGAMRTGESSFTPFFIGVCIVAALAFAGLFTAALVVFGSAGLFAPFTLAGRGLALAAGAWLAITLVAALVLSGRSDSFRRLVGFALANAFVVLPIGPLALCVANQRLDTSAVRDHRMPIRNAYMESSDGEDQLFIEFVSPIDPAETVTIGFEGAAVPPPGTAVYVRTRDGGLGYAYRLEAHYGP